MQINNKKRLLLIVIVITFLLSPFLINNNDGLIHSNGYILIYHILISLLHLDLSFKTISLAVISTIRTLSYAIAGSILAIIIGFILGVLSSNVLITNRLISNLFKNILEVMRTIHELVWAWLLVSAFGLSPFSGIFAIAIPYGGILGRIYCNHFNSVPKEPIFSLKNSGASKLQCLFYGYIPIIKADILSYTLYRSECAVRSSTVMSFVGLGGLGYQIQLSLDDLNFNKAWTYILFLVILVYLIDLWSSAIRKRLVK